QCFAADSEGKYLVYCGFIVVVALRSARSNELHMQQAPEFLQAISQRDGSAAMQLLSENAALARVRNPQGVSALMLARYFNLPDLADAMLASHTELDVFEAATFGRGERLRALLDGDASLVRARSADTGTALHFACFFAQPEAVKLLLAAGSDVAAVAA